MRQTFKKLHMARDVTNNLKNQNRFLRRLRAFLFGSFPSTQSQNQRCEAWATWGGCSELPTPLALLAEKRTNEQVYSFILSIQPRHIEVSGNKALLPIWNALDFLSAPGILHTLCTNYTEPGLLLLATFCCLHLCPPAQLQSTSTLS